MNRIQLQPLPYKPSIYRNIMTIDDYIREIKYWSLYVSIVMFYIILPMIYVIKHM